MTYSIYLQDRSVDITAGPFIVSRETYINGLKELNNSGHVHHFEDKKDKQITLKVFTDNCIDFSNWSERLFNN